MLFHYLLYTRCFQGLGPEVMHRVLDLFKLFNSSTRSLVLNAGAVSQGFLKRISARHLALASQCIGSCIELVTVVQTALILYLPTNQHALFNELMKGLTILLDNHRNQLFDKFPEIIKAVAEKSCADLEVSVLFEVKYSKFNGLRQFLRLHLIWIN